MNDLRNVLTSICNFTKYNLSALDLLLTLNGISSTQVESNFFLWPFYSTDSRKKEKVLT